VLEHGEGSAVRENDTQDQRQKGEQNGEEKRIRHVFVRPPRKITSHSSNHNSPPFFMVEGFGLKPITKMHLTPNSFVANLLKMLTYSCVCCAFSSTHALLLDVIYYF
jgi:hypothetical protein